MLLKLGSFRKCEFNSGLIITIIMIEFVFIIQIHKKLYITRTNYWIQSDKKFTKIK